MYDAVVIGAGIAGLSAAFQLASAGQEVLVLEAGPRTGGVAHTVYEHGVLLEEGPQSMQSTPPICRLLGRLGLRDRVVGPDPSAALRYVLRDGALHPLPHSLIGAASSPLIGPRTLLRLLSEPARRAHGAGDTDLAELITRRFGAGVLPLLDAFIAGVFGGDPRALDAETAFADLARADREGSVLFGALRVAGETAAQRPTWAPRPLLTLGGGMSELVDTLTDRLADRVRCASPVTGLRRVRDGYEVDAGGIVRARRVIWTAPPEALARALGPLDLPPLPRAPIVAVHLAWPREHVPLKGFGWLCAPDAGADVLGALWVSSVFPGQTPGWSVIRVMMGGTRDPGVAEASDAELLDRAVRSCAAHERVARAPSFSRITRAVPGIPQPPVGWASAVRRLETRNPGLRVLGWTWKGVGVSHAVAQAERVTAPGA